MFQMGEKNARAKIGVPMCLRTTVPVSVSLLFCVPLNDSLHNSS